MRTPGGAKHMPEIQMYIKERMGIIIILHYFISNIWMTKV